MQNEISNTARVILIFARSSVIYVSLICYIFF